MNKTQGGECSSGPHEKWHDCWGKMCLWGPGPNSGEARTSSVPLRVKVGRIFQRVRRTSADVHPVLDTPMVSRSQGAAVGAPVKEERAAALDRQTPRPSPQPSFLCCLAASDVWVCREVPEWALEIGHSLPVPPALTHM